MLTMPMNKIEPAGANMFLTSDSYTMEDVERACEGISADDPVNAVIAVFYRTLSPGLKFGSPFVRKDAAAVVKAFGAEGAIRLAKCAVRFYHREYFPQAATPKELLAKMARISAALAKIMKEGGYNNKFIVL